MSSSKIDLLKKNQYTKKRDIVIELQTNKKNKSRH